MKRIDLQPIFITGAPRSGTTLLAAILAAHTRLSCGPETRFFKFLSYNDETKLLFDWPNNAVDFLFSIKLSEVPVPVHYQLSSKQIFDFLNQRTPSVPNILAALTEQFMIREGKQRWIEKSPENTLHANLIRIFFPRSPIINIIRDPRDVALSMLKTPDSWAPSTFQQALWLWKQYDKMCSVNNDNNNLYYEIQFEDLVENPEYEVRKLCKYLGEEFESNMLSTSKSASKVITETEIWKHLASKPIQKSRARVWQKELTKEENRFSQSLIGDRLIHYNYSYNENFRYYAKIYPSINLIINDKKLLENLHKNNIKFWKNEDEDIEQIIIYIGDPDRDRWLSSHKPRRWLETVKIAGQIIYHKISGIDIYWITHHEGNNVTGISTYILSFVFKIVGAHNNI